MESGMRMLLGVALVAHGLGNAVLLLRGVDWISEGRWSLPLLLACLMAIIGFVKVGLGILGVRPLAHDLTAMVLVAGLCSLAAQARLGDGDLWAGVMLSLALPALTTVFVAVYGERAPVRHRWWHVAGDAAGIAFFAWIAASATLWPLIRTWGTEPHEWVMTLPGDRPARAPAHEILHGISIDAPPSAVWPWLVQLGQDRAGFYSYERLERLVGAQVRNVREIRPEWQSRRVGDRVYAAPSGYLSRVLDERPGWNVTYVAPNEALVLENWGAFVLVPDIRGGTRFLIRSTVSHDRIPPWAAALNLSAFELPHLIMQRRMMLNIKGLAERGA
jgi:hypothetical protein